MKAIFIPLFAVAIGPCITLAADIPPAADQIASAILAAPEDRRAAILAAPEDRPPFWVTTPTARSSLSEKGRTI